MRNILNITNGDCAAEIMKKADIPGSFLLWRDVLHEGPVPGNISFPELSAVRKDFIASRGWGKAEKIRQHFIERDNELNSIDKYDKVVLWFEHDLYDQLQLLQILDWLHDNPIDATEKSIICINRYLGQLSPAEMRDLLKLEEPIAQAHLLLANKAWSAFRAPSPGQWYGLLNIDTGFLPFLKGAVIRLLEEYPSSTNGLSRTAQQALKIVSEGETRPGRIFNRNQELEDRMFMGDLSFWGILDGFLKSDPPLLELKDGQALTIPISPDQELKITQTGKDVLGGRRNWLDLSAIDRWLGGVHLTPGNTWCWESEARVLAKRPAQGA